jgi:hypothetical protein
MEMKFYFTVLRCIISVKILINGLFSYWIFLAKKNDHTLAKQATGPGLLKDSPL